MTDMSINLSENFTLASLCHSDTANAAGIKNIPNAQEVKNLQELVTTILQPFRKELGLPILVNSGFRNPQTNKLVGGVSNSAHLKGLAADIQCPKFGVPRALALRLEKFLKDNKIPFDQLIRENFGRSDWVHIAVRDLNGKQRGQVLTMNRNGTHKGII